MKHSTGKPTKYEGERIKAMLRLGCCYCAKLNVWFTAECHHIVEGNRLGHWYTLPVCPGHHRGVWTPGQVEVIPPDLRIAISDGSKLLEKHYGTERDHWMNVQHRLKLPAIWPITKIVPRRLGGSHEMGLSLEGSSGPVSMDTDALPAAGGSTQSGETVRAAVGEAP